MPNDTLSIEKMKIAQERYENYLIDHIPDDAKKILDIGCGTGALIKKLTAIGYDTEGLSPDKNQKNLLSKTKEIVFHHSKFDDFHCDQKYDCLIMSESCQYININKVFDNSSLALKEGGHLMICDYFVFNKSSDLMGKSGHPYKAFMELAKEKGFSVEFEEDITDSILKTLDFSKNIAERAIIGFHIGTEKTKERHPYLYKLCSWMLRKPIKKIKSQLKLLDSSEFKKHKTYQFILFKKI
ncbi:MAG: class I SAM-dependent DNA methyltransferase [Cellvibrionaceae bacterium]